MERNPPYRSPCALWLGIAVCLSMCSGATCRPWARPVADASPVMFDHTPTLGEVIQKINQNTLAVRYLSADGVRISTPGAPSLKATLELEMPNRLRIQGDLLMTRELDIGSNDDVFWIWGRTAPGAMLFASHRDYAAGVSSDILPIDPRWLIDALGLVMFDPAAQHQGPYAHGPGQMEVHSQVISARGEPLTKVTVLHAIYGWILEQQIRDGQGRILAAASARNHRYYPGAGVTLPDLVDIHLAPGRPEELAIRVDVGGYRVNQPLQRPADIFTMPRYDGYPVINLADPHAVDLRRAVPPPGPVTNDPYSRDAYRPEYRGYTRR